MNFRDVIKLTNDIIDEVDIDEQIESIVKSAINYAYMIVVSKVDKRTELLDITYSKVLKLPDNFVSLIDIMSGDIILTKTEYSIKSDVLIFHTNKFSNLKLVYNKTISPLVNDNDILDIDDRYCMACATYGAYVYSIHRKRVELANLLYSDFNNLINSDKSNSKLEVNGFDLQRNA